MQRESCFRQGREPVSLLVSDKIAFELQAGVEGLDVRPRRHQAT